MKVKRGMGGSNGGRSRWDKTEVLKKASKKLRRTQDDCETQHGYEITDDWRFWPACATCGGMCPKKQINCPSCKDEQSSKEIRR